MSRQEEIRKVQPQLELKLERDIKGSTEGFYRYAGNKRKMKGTVGLLAGDVATKNTEKA